MKQSTKTFLVYPVLGLVLLGGGFTAGRMSFAPGAASAAAGAAGKKSGSGGGSFLTRIMGGGTAEANVSMASLLGVKGKPDALAMALWAKGLSPAEAQSALKELQTMAPGAQRNALLNAVVGAWAENDPHGFLAASAGIKGPKAREDGVIAALKAMAGQNPQEAMDWLKQNGGGTSTAIGQQRYLAAIAGFAAADPKGAMSVIAALGEDTNQDYNLKRNALQALSTALAEQGQYSEAAAMFAAMPAGAWQNQAYQGLVQKWAQDAPQDAAAFIATLTDPQSRLQMERTVAANWGLNDPAAAAAWAAQIDGQEGGAVAANQGPGGRGGRGGPGGGTQPGQLLAGTIASWANYDLDASAVYLNQLPASAAKDNAVAVYAAHAAATDAQGALGWVNTIADEPMRQRAALVVAAQLMQQDQNAYNTMLGSNLLSDQSKQLLQNIPANMVSELLNGGGGGPGGRGGPGGGGPGGGGPGGGAPAAAAATPATTTPVDNMILNGGGPLMDGGPGGRGPGGRGGRGG